jgi:hypothetical protein
MDQQLRVARQGRDRMNARRRAAAVLVFLLVLLMGTAAAAVGQGPSDVPAPEFTPTKPMRRADPVRGFKNLGRPVPPDPNAKHGVGPTTVEEIRAALQGRTGDIYNWRNAPALYQYQDDPPTAEQLKDIRDSPRYPDKQSEEYFLQKWKRTRNPRLGPEELREQWIRFRDLEIRNTRSLWSGTAFAERLVRALELGPGWYTEVQMWTSGRRFRTIDLMNPAAGIRIILEIKSTDSALGVNKSGDATSQIKADLQLMDQWGLTGLYVVGQPVSATSLTALKTLSPGGRALEAPIVYPAVPYENGAPYVPVKEQKKQLLRAVATGLAEVVEQKKVTGLCAGASGHQPMVLAAGDCPPSSSGLSKGVLGAAQQDLGGVDFSSLQLRYVSDDPKTHALRYAYSARPGSPTTADPGHGVTTLRASAADLRTWLTLDPSTFWVNLNPDEPNRVIDPKVGRTNAGRAMLEADYALKSTTYRLVDPNTPFGAKYWSRMQAAARSRTICYTSRLWIVPGPVTVRQDGDSIYVLDAPLDVKTQSEHLDDPAVACPDAPPETLAREQRVDSELLIPKVREKINTAREYAPLRQAFMARIIAQWIRDRHAEGRATAFDGVIGTEDLGPAELKDGWRPTDVYNAYVRQFRSDAYSYTKRVRQGDTTIVYRLATGGVEFQEVKPRDIGAAAMSQRYPGLPATVDRSVSDPAGDSGGTLWLGSTSPGEDPGVIRGWTGAVGRLADGKLGTAGLVVGVLIVLTLGFRLGRRREHAA